MWELRVLTARASFRHGAIWGALSGIGRTQYGCPGAGRPQWVDLVARLSTALRRHGGGRAARGGDGRCGGFSDNPARGLGRTEAAAHDHDEADVHDVLHDHDHDDDHAADDDHANDDDVARLWDADTNRRHGTSRCQRAGRRQLEGGSREPDVPIRRADP
jgi:hypothetical protein